MVGWQAGVAGELYLDAMERGEVFFIATGRVDGKPMVLGFSSDYSIEGSTHGTSVYVRGIRPDGASVRLCFVRLSRMRLRTAQLIRIEASLAGAPFYEVNGYLEVGRGEVRLLSGYPIQCVFMQKSLTPAGC